MRYQSGGTFRRALEQRLRTLSLQRGVSLSRLRKIVVFDRFLARLMQNQPDQWIVKGRLALQLRLKGRARTTKDMDLSALMPPSNVYSSLNNAAKLDLRDWFSFEVARTEQEPTQGFGALRYSVHARLDTRTFEDFHIDVGITGSLIGSADFLATTSLLEFAGLQATCVPCFPVPVQIAEKVHAFTRPRISGEPSRVKDFVDILLLARMGQMEGKRLHYAIDKIFEAASTHAVPSSLPSPPSHWEQTYRRIASDIGLDETRLDSAFSLIQKFLDPVLSGNMVAYHWDPSGWTWKAIKE